MHIKATFPVDNTFSAITEAVLRAINEFVAAHCAVFPTSLLRVVVAVPLVAFRFQMLGVIYA